MDFSIRPTEPRDAEGFAALRRMPGVFEQTLGIPSARVQDSVEKLSSPPPGMHSFTAVTTGENGQELVIGVAGLNIMPPPRERHVGRIGIFVHRDYQNMGVGRALMETLLDLADNWLMLVRVELTVFTDNERAIHLYQSLGFEREGLMRCTTIRGGAYVDQYIMARLRLPGGIV